jgi:hypothetical protein
METAVFIVNLLVDLGLLLLLLHRKAHKWLPWFVCYIAWDNPAHSLLTLAKKEKNECRLLPKASPKLLKSQSM